MTWKVEFSKKLITELNLDKCKKLRQFEATEIENVYLCMHLQKI